MEKAYSGLRRKRKRAHSTKCPCCYSSEDEPDIHASSPKPKNAGETPVIGKRTRGRKGPKVDDGDTSINSEVKENAQEVVGDEKNRAAIKKQVSKKTKEREKKVVIFSEQGCSNDSEEKDVCIQSKQPGKEANKFSKKESKKNQKSAKLQQSTIKLSDERKSNDKFLNGSKRNELGKSARNESKTKASKLSVDRKRTAKEVASVGKTDKELSEPNEKPLKKAKSKMVAYSKNEDMAEIEHKGIRASAGNETKSKSMLKNVQSVDSVSGSLKKQKGGKGGIKRSNGKNQGNRSSSFPENPMEKKIKVFDHLFSELKKCTGHSKTTISMATELFLSITSEKLKVLIQVPVSKMSKGEKIELREAVDTTLLSNAAGESNGKHSESENAVVQAADMNDNCLSSPRKRGSTKSEEAKLSQAAEALVSFRTKPSVLRQEKPEVDLSETVLHERNIAQKSFEKKGEDVVSNDVNGNCVSSQAKVAVTQVVSTSNEARSSQTGIGYSVPSRSALQSQPTQNLVFHGALSQPLNSPGNLHHVSATQQFFTFGQLTSQTSPSLTATPQIHPAVTMASSGNGPSVAAVQNLQALICTSPQQPSNFPVSSTCQPTGTSQSVGTAQQRVSLSQPLKGMEDVVSCVGSQSAAAVLWNIKPAAPVVYITSPQTLGGVRARNIFPNEGQSVLPFVTSPAKATSMAVPKTSVNLQSADWSVLAKVTRVHQSTPLSSSQPISGHTKRPILPREQKMPPSLHSGGAATTQFPVSPMAVQVPGSVQSVGPGNIALQSGNSVASLALNSQPSTTVPTQALNVTSQSYVSNTVALAAVNAKQAVKRFVHERTKSAEMKRTASLGSISSTDPLFIPSTSPELAENVSPLSSVQSLSVQPVMQTEHVDTSKASEFNLQQAASALLSIGSQDGIDIGDMLQPAVDGDDSLDEPDDEVVFTSKGVFRVGDVDVDPKYNRIGREGYTCGKCGKIFTSLSYLARHIKRVCPDMSCRKWKCTMCDKAFRHPFGLQQHIYTHTGERPHKCSQCPKAFYSSNDLRRHSRIHSGERPYHCKHCEKSFATTISLKTHTYIHTGEKPHKCPHCPKTFATSSKLGRHIVTHSEERPFTCNLCPKSFNRSGDLRRHNMHVHESRDKAFDWDDCGGPLGTPDYVDAHMDSTDDREENQHQDCEVSNLCPLSSTTFNSNSHLEQLMTIQDPAQALASHRKFNQSLDVI